MDKIAEQFQNDVVTRYQQKMAGLLKVATPVENQESPIVPADAGGEGYGSRKADTMQIPETTWFENLANSAPVSGMLDAIDAASNAISNPFTAAKNFAGDIGTSLGELVNSYDPTLNAIANMESDFDTISDAITIAKAKKNMNDMANEYGMRPEQVWAKQLLDDPLSLGGMANSMRRAAWPYKSNKGLFPGIETKSPVAQGLF